MVTITSRWFCTLRCHRVKRTSCLRRDGHGHKPRYRCFNGTAGLQNPPSVSFDGISLRALRAGRGQHSRGEDSPHQLGHQGNPPVLFRCDGFTWAFNEPRRATDTHITFSAARRPATGLASGITRNRPGICRAVAGSRSLEPPASDSAAGDSGNPSTPPSSGRSPKIPNCDRPPPVSLRGELNSWAPDFWEALGSQSPISLVCRRWERPSNAANFAARRPGLPHHRRSALISAREDQKWAGFRPGTGGEPRRLHGRFPTGAAACSSPASPGSWSLGGSRNSS